MEHSLAAGLLAHQQRASHSRYPATSSAFSASAHPHEDWTKISDLAERRRIQNRIAQRNYRKKLKRRLEDLERKAASPSPSPEAQPTQLPQQQKTPARRFTNPSAASSPQKPSVAARTVSPRPSHQQSLAALISLPEPALFSAEQFSSKPMSLSPPSNFSYPIPSSEAFSFTPFSSSASPFSAANTSCDSYAFSYNSLPASSWLSTSATGAFPTTATSSSSTSSLYKSDNFFPELDMSNFTTFQFAPASIEGSNSLFSTTGTDSLPQTPPLSECHELYVAGACSPSDSAFLPTTPPMPFQAGPTMTMV